MCHTRDKLIYMQSSVSQKVESSHEIEAAQKYKENQPRPYFNGFSAASLNFLIVNWSSKPNK